MRKAIPVLLLLFLSAPLPAYGEEPMTVVRERVEKVISILNNPEYKSKKSLQREKIMEIVRQVFDFRTMSQLSLAKYWRDFTPQQQQEFTDLFSKLLENVYLDRIQGKYQDQKVVYEGQETIAADRAVVRTRVTGKDMNIPVDYRMLKQGDTWKVYDVVIEGVSLVQNYRSQFREILISETPAQLIERLRKKVGKK